MPDPCVIQAQPESHPSPGEEQLSSRMRRLRGMYWEKTHEALVEANVLEGCGDPSAVGRATDFVTLLDLSRPQIQSHELIAGVALVRPAEGSTLDLGHYNSHFPPGYPNLLRLGFAGIRDRAKEKLRGETDPERRDFLEAVVLSYDGACRFARKYCHHLRELAATAPSGDRAGEFLDRIAEFRPWK